MLQGVLVSAAFLLTSALSGVATAQGGYIAEANALYDDIADERNSAPVLLPALANMTAAPAIATDPGSLRLLTPESSAWPEVERWVTATPQQDALDALRAVTEGEDYLAAMAFAQPYGASGIAVEFIRAGLYTELGDPPLLADADHGYLEPMRTLALLVQAEAKRLASEGNVAAGLDLLFSLMVLGRQLADREFVVEAATGYAFMGSATRRMRELVYVDFKGDQAVSLEGLRDIIEKLDREGQLAIDRLSFPRADRIAAEQIIAFTYEERGGIRRPEFIQTMTRLSTSGRPLRRFAASARWSEAADTQVDWFDIREALEKAYSGWTRRWLLEPGSPVLNLPFPVQEFSDTERYAAVAMSLRTIGSDLFDLRDAVEVERVGTRLSFAVLGRYYEQGRYPTSLADVRPRWISEIESDAFDDPSALTDAKDEMHFFVPVRDDYVADMRDDPEPHFMEVFPGDGTNFGLELYEDQFVLYSVGPNAADDNAARVHTDFQSQFGDYLVWPPVVGLQREHLRQVGGLD